MLLLIGLGLRTKDLSARALEEIKDADLLFIETYTAFITNDYIAYITKQAGKRPTLLKRGDLEDNLKKTVSMAKRKKMVILVIGDPLIATTHSIILNEARTQGIKSEVVHAPSVFSVAIGESGLDVYRFGPTVTIPFWSKHYRPTSFITVIKNNIDNNEHTLALLDIDQEKGRPMSIEEAAVLLDAVDIKAPRIIGMDHKILILGNLGRKDQAVRYVTLSGINSKIKKEFKGKVLSLVIPSKPTFAEEESLKRITS